MKYKNTSISADIQSIVDIENEIVRKMNAVLRTHGEAPQRLVDELETNRSHGLKTLYAYVQEHGWPTHSTTSEKTALNAWLIAQHAVVLPDVCARFLALMKVELDRGLVPGWHYAFLYDRYAQHSGRPQLFGTLLVTNERGEIVPYWLDQAQTVDERRARLNLPTMAATLAQTRDYTRDQAS